MRRGIPEVLASWHVYGPEFDSCIPAASVKYIWHDFINQQFLRNAVQQRVTGDLREQHSGWFHSETVANHWPGNLPQLVSVRLWSIMFSPPPAFLNTLDVTPCAYHAMIYCNIISPQSVADGTVHFMRTFPTTSCWHYETRNVQYVPVEQRQFQSIRIEFLTLE